MEFKRNQFYIRFQSSEQANYPLYSYKKLNNNSYVFCSSNALIEYNFINHTIRKNNFEISVKDVEFENDSVYLATSNGVYKTLYQNIVQGDKLVNQCIKLTTDYTRFLISYKKNIYAFSSTGIKIINNNKIIDFYNNNELFKNSVSDVKLHDTGLMYVASKGFGVAKINLNTQQINFYNSQNISSAFKIRMDKKNNIWLLADNGIFRHSESKNNFDLFVSNSVFLKNKIVDFNFFNDSLCVISKNKVFKLPLSHTENITIPKPVEIQHIYFNDKEIKDTAINVMLDGEATMRFDFKSIVINNHDHLLYQYKLKGFDKGFHVTNHEEIRYTNLPAALMF